MYIKHPDKIFSTTVIKYYCSSSKLSTYYFWQGRQGSNLRPSVLETDALPTELLPYQDAKYKETGYFVSLCKVCFRSHLQYLRTSIRSVFNFLLREAV